MGHDISGKWVVKGNNAWAQNIIFGDGVFVSTHYSFANLWNNDGGQGWSVDLRSIHEEQTRINHNGQSNGYKHVNKGTYRIKGNRLEMVLGDKSERVMIFIHRENTLTLMNSFGNNPVKFVRS